MASAGSVSGLVSGIDTGALVDAMIEADRQSVVLLENKKELAELHQEAVQSLNLKLLDADLSTTQLKRSSTFEAKTVTSSDDAVATASAFSRAGAGTYTVEVTALAQAHQVSTTASVTDKEATDFSGTFNVIMNGETTEVALDGAASMQDLVVAINSAGAGLQASIVNAGAGGADDFRLIIQAEQTGADSSFSFDTTSSNAALQDLLGSGANPLQTLVNGQDSAVTVTIGTVGGGLQVSGSAGNNEITDLIDGVTITAKEVGTTTMTIGFDTEPAISAVTNFFESFNEALTYFADNATYDSNAEEAGVLFGDSSIRSGLESVKRALINGASGDHTGTVKTLSSLGITINEKTGRFDIDEATLKAKINSDPKAVSALFVEDGLGQRIDDAMSRLTDSIDGVVAGKDRALTSEISRLDDRIDEMDDRLLLRRQRYEAEFLAMEKLMAQFQSQEQFLAGQLEAFSNLAAGTAGRNK